LLDAYELERYERQIRVLGEKGQEKLKAARVFVAGTGGLGSSVALYLAVAGIGSLTIADNDVVELSNLNRQVLHWDRDVGESKVQSAYEKLSQVNPRVDLKVLNETIGEDNVSRLIGDTDAVVDALDNFQTRYILNKAGLRRGIPLFHGAVHGFNGQVATMIPRETACLRCIFPSAPQPQTFPVIGATAGIIGAIQATEVIKYFTGTGELLRNKLLFYDGERMEFYRIDVQVNPRCPDCGVH